MCHDFVNQEGEKLRGRRAWFEPAVEASRVKYALGIATGTPLPLNL
jgi:hypothetical protein